MGYRKIRNVEFNLDVYKDIQFDAFKKEFWAHVAYKKLPEKVRTSTLRADWKELTGVKDKPKK